MAQSRCTCLSNFVVASMVIVACIQSGCRWFLGDPVDEPFGPGTYSAEVPCEIDVVRFDGQTGHDEFTSSVVVEIDDAGNFVINDVTIEEGAEVVREIPNATLAFEVIEVTRVGNLITVTYEPRPTLPGIEVEGLLVEEYLWQGSEILGTAEADLTLTDVDGDSLFTINCEAVLVRE